jgi:hypothetical protein
MKRTVLVLYLLAASPAISFAQAPQQPPQSPAEQALSGKLGEEYNQNLQLRAAVIQSREQITALQKQVDDLKAKCGDPCKGHK